MTDFDAILKALNEIPPKPFPDKESYLKQIGTIEDVPVFVGSGDPRVYMKEFVDNHLDKPVDETPNPNTIRGKLHKYLTNNNLWPAEATKILDIYFADPDHVDVTNRQNDSAEGYPVEFFALVYFQLDEIALKWIDENKPLHCARPMFAKD